MPAPYTTAAMASRSGQSESHCCSLPRQPLSEASTEKSAKPAVTAV
jgi:hypothetical protein